MYLSTVSMTIVNRRLHSVPEAHLHSTLVKTKSAYCNVVGIAYISHLETGRVQLEFIEQVEGRSHDLECVLVPSPLRNDRKLENRPSS